MKIVENYTKQDMKKIENLKVKLQLVICLIFYYGEKFSLRFIQKNFFQFIMIKFNLLSRLKKQQ